MWNLGATLAHPRPSAYAAGVAGEGERADVMNCRGTQSTLAGTDESAGQRLRRLLISAYLTTVPGDLL